MGQPLFKLAEADETCTFKSAFNLKALIPERPSAGEVVRYFIFTARYYEYSQFTSPWLTYTIPHCTGHCVDTTKLLRQEA